MTHPAGHEDAHEVAAPMATLAAEGQRNGAGCPGRGMDEGDGEARAFTISLGAAMDNRVEGRILIGAADDTLAAKAET